MSKTITVIKGDGIGPEIMDATLQVLDATGADLDYEFVDAGLAALEKAGELLPQTTLDTIAKNGVCLKSPLTTPVGKGFSSINVALRKHFDLYANLRPAITFPGTRSKYDNVDIITVRENTEGAYMGEGSMINDDRTYAETKIIVTRKGSERIARFAFETARRDNRKKVTAVHKANIMKNVSGLFLEVCQEVAKDYPDIEFDSLIVDNTCMQLVMNPERFDMIVTTNLFGDIISDLCAGLVGGLGMAPGANIGKDKAIFEAVHGSAPDIAGKKIANPTALILAAALMLEHLDIGEKATAIRQAIRDVLASKDRLTPDLGGSSHTDEFAQAVVERLS